MIIGIISIIVDDIGVAFIFPIYIIMKTKRYLPKLWDDSRQIILENNDFYSSNPNAVAPWQSTNQQRAETRFWEPIRILILNDDFGFNWELILNGVKIQKNSIYV